MVNDSITHLKEGQKAPAFSAVDQHNDKFSTRDMIGKKWVLFFYPNDLTATCTIEVCNLRDHYKELQKAGYEVIGISRGEVASKKRFADKNKLPFRLLADTNLKISSKYGVFGDKLFMGKVIESIYRTTFLINEMGKIDRIIRKVHSKDAAGQILSGR
jgi:peroxiredoxin Q/BCP